MRKRGKLLRGGREECVGVLTERERERIFL